VSKKSLQELKPLKIKDLKYEICHKGQYLLCQTIEPPNATDLVVTLVQDEDGEVDVVGIRFFLQENLPCGSIIIIKEPYYKCLGDSGLIRVDSPSNIIRVSKNDLVYKNLHMDKIVWKEMLNQGLDRVFESPVPDSAEKWKIRGNQLYLKKFYGDAHDAYSRGIEEVESRTELWKLLMLNKAACSIALQKYELAITDLIQVLEFDSKSEKGLFRAGKCFYALGKYKDALNLFSKLYDYYKSENVLEEIEKTSCRLKEQETGEYDLFKMYKEADASKVPDLEYADYSGPIEIQEISGKGRGIVATKDISPGTLLIAAKAFSVVYGTEKDTLNKCIHLNLASDKAISPTSYKLMSRILQKMQTNASFAAKVYELCSGKESENSKVDGHIFDPDLIEKICQMNAFSLEHFGANNSLQHLHDSCALFTRPVCYLNHSCDRNASRFFIGDFIFIHAVAPISKGSEILISYINPVENLSRRKLLLEDYGFNCDCKFCTMDSNMDYSLLEKWNAEILSHLQNGDTKILPKAVQMLNSMKEQVSANTLNENDLFLPMVALGSLYERMQDFKSANELYGSTLNLKFCPDLAIHCALHVSLNYSFLQDEKSSREWLLKAQKLGHDIFGLDPQVFDLLYSDFTKDLVK
jgi:tetratricopeptide (TPR) repeat protein